MMLLVDSIIYVQLGAFEKKKDVCVYRFTKLLTMTMRIARHGLDPRCQVELVDSDPEADYYCVPVGYSQGSAARHRNECPCPETRSPSSSRPEAQRSPAWGAEQPAVPPCCRAIVRVKASRAVETGVVAWVGRPAVWAVELVCRERDDARPAAGGLGGDGETRCSARPSLLRW
jgi:hypothetical protein